MNSQLIESLAEATDVPLSPFGRLQLEADNFQHRARRVVQRQWDLTIGRLREGWLGEMADAGRICGAAVLSYDPPVLFAHYGSAPRPVLSLSAFLADRPVLFLFLIGWSLELPARLETLRKGVKLHRGRYPNHGLVFLCNTAEEARLLDAAGIEAIFANHNQLVSEHVFRPLPGTTPLFDAVYNGKISRFKRHHLAAAIDRVLYVAFRCPHDMSPSAGRAYLQRMLTRSPGHRIANPLVDGLPTYINREQVNEAYNQASVGLCLSAVEGAMYSSMEYMLAGLPVVTTPSLGGRDVFFDPDYCLIVDHDPRAIRDAVIALRDLSIPRHVVRQRTLERVEAVRRRGQELVGKVLERHGIELDAAAIWPPRKGADAITWKPVRSHIDDLRTLQRE